VGGASAPRVTDKARHAGQRRPAHRAETPRPQSEEPSHAGRRRSTKGGNSGTLVRSPRTRGGDAPPTGSSPTAPLPRRATYDLPSQPLATVPFEAPNGALDISHGCKPVGQGHPAITRSPRRLRAIRDVRVRVFSLCGSFAPRSGAGGRGRRGRASRAMPQASAPQGPARGAVSPTQGRRAGTRFALHLVGTVREAWEP